MQTFTMITFLLFYQPLRILIKQKQKQFPLVSRRSMDRPTSETDKSMVEN